MANPPAMQIICFFHRPIRLTIITAPILSVYPGYTPKDPNGDPLKPVDPDDPTKGYIPPPITDPNDPGKDTPVPYEKDPEPTESKSMPPKEKEPNNDQGITRNETNQDITNEMVSPQKVITKKDEQPPTRKTDRSEMQILPQTGEKENILGSLGILSLTLGTLGLFMYRKKEDK
ncbi:LPXTG cell wall anchor domain-containing protein [uncultured Ligilactobacillus sp.]|uniref:LPXTG cell wall anchor domain-containing protein n=1 Tax=uncultured Ligilactobacillus sp. TaxID=2837633 RepID=UPI00272AA886|nr:LPXTG cell wall anchor domain-containing protein [uncultured Ligilactobacillus sp.]